MGRAVLADGTRLSTPDYRRSVPCVLYKLLGDGRFMTLARSQPNKTTRAGRTQIAPRKPSLQYESSVRISNAWTSREIMPFTGSIQLALLPPHSRKSVTNHASEYPARR